MGLYRVFARAEDVPAGEQIQSWLSELAPSSQAELAVEAGEWVRIDWTVGSGAPLILERYHVREEGLRAELNSWAGVLETCDDSPHHGPLMERTIQACQLFILSLPLDRADEAALDHLCETLCRRLAGHLDGFYQIDDRGFFEADGTLLVQER